MADCTVVFKPHLNCDLTVIGHVQNVTVTSQLNLKVLGAIRHKSLKCKNVAQC